MKRASSWIMTGRSSTIMKRRRTATRTSSSCWTGSRKCVAYMSYYLAAFLDVLLDLGVLLEEALAALLGDGELRPVGRVVAREHVDRRVERREGLLAAHVREAAVERHLCGNRPVRRVLRQAGRNRHRHAVEQVS